MLVVLMGLGCFVMAGIGLLLPLFFDGVEGAWPAAITVALSLVITGSSLLCFGGLLVMMMWGVYRRNRPRGTEA